MANKEQLNERDLNDVVGGKYCGVSSEIEKEEKCEPTKERVLTNHDGRFLQGEKLVCSDPINKGTKSQCANCPVRNK